LDEIKGDKGSDSANFGRLSCTGRVVHYRSAVQCAFCMGLDDVLINVLTQVKIAESNFKNIF
jgi:hypothetical protein